MASDSDELDIELSDNDEPNDGHRVEGGSSSAAPDAELVEPADPAGSEMGLGSNGTGAHTHTHTHTHTRDSTRPIESDSDAALDIDLSDNETGPDEGDVAHSRCNDAPAGVPAQTERTPASQGPEEDQPKGGLITVPKNGVIPKKAAAEMPHGHVPIDVNDLPPQKHSPSPVTDGKVGEKRVLKRSEMDEVSTHVKKGKKAATPGAGVELRNLAKVKLHEMT
jgi:hypothetical protein